MAARKRRLQLTDAWREKIKAGVIMHRLLSHLEGEIEMSPTQIKAADILLRKIVPDLNRSEITGEDGGPMVVELIRFGDSK